jgi:hypothetical protein
MVFFIIGITVFILSAIGFMVALGLWTYADAQVKSNDSPVMWTLIVLLTGLIGIIIYFAAGRKKPEKSPGKFKKLLIAAVVCYALSFPLYIISLIMFIMEMM